MNDVEKAFAYQDEGLKEERDFANKHLPKLAEFVNSQEDKEFIYFIQRIVDYYMMNVCRLGRRK